MTEIPEHLLKRAQAARDKAKAEAEGAPSPDLPEHLRSRNTDAEVGMATLDTEIAKVEDAFYVNLVVVPIGMPKEDAEAALNALAPLGDMSPEFLNSLASLVLRNTASE